MYFKKQRHHIKKKINNLNIVFLKIYSIKNYSPFCLNDDRRQNIQMSSNQGKRISGSLRVSN